MTTSCPHHGVTSELDYEAELGVIIGRGGRGISRDDAFAHVWGYTIIDDFTARDLQRKHKQWTLGKGLDTHCPMGPYAVSADEIADVTALQVQSFVNGEPRQNGTVKDLIFDIPELIAVISAGITLLPGDIIATGTPAGVGHRVRPAQVHGLRRRRRDRDHRPGRPAQPHRRLTRRSSHARQR